MEAILLVRTVFTLLRELYLSSSSRRGLKLGILVLAMLILVACYPPLGLSFLIGKTECCAKGT